MHVIIYEINIFTHFLKCEVINYIICEKCNYSRVVKMYCLKIY